MAAPVNIKGGIKGLKAEVVKPEGEEAGLVVYQERYKVLSNKVKAFTNSTYGVGLNQNVTLGGTTVGIHDGGDHTWWTAAVISGIWDFAAEAQTKNGTYSVSGVSTVDGNTASFTPGVAQDLTGHSAISGYIYLSSWTDSGIKGIQIYGWETTTPGIVGNVVNIKDYINIYTLGVWQLFVIPLTDMGLVTATIDQIRVTTVNGVPGSAPDYYIDLLNVIETGTPLEYKIEADKDTWLHVEKLSIFLADNYPATAALSTMPDIPYNAFLGVPELSSGLNYRRSHDGIVEFSAQIRSIGDLMKWPGSVIQSYGSNSKNSWVKIALEFIEPVVLKSENQDYLSVTLSEDLSGTSVFEIYAGCREEKR